MRKIGLLTMALVLALGTLGVAYAAWTDEVTIAGEVHTGDVDLQVRYYGGTWVYKNVGGDDSLEQVFGGTAPWFQYGWRPYHDDEDYLPVASAEAKEGSDTDILVHIDNLFPGLPRPLLTGVILEYTGTVPARLFAEITDVDAPPDLLNNLQVGFSGWAYGDDPHLVQFLGGEEIDIGHQVHEGDLVFVWVTVEVDQVDEAMGQSGTFEARIVAVQWNEYDQWVAEQ